MLPVAWEVQLYMYDTIEERKTTDVQKHRGWAREEEKTNQVIQIAFTLIFWNKTLRQLKAVKAIASNLFNETNHEWNAKNLRVKKK